MFKKIMFFVYIFFSLFAICFGAKYIYDIQQLKDPQDDYAYFLVDKNNDFAKLMYDFLKLNENLDANTGIARENMLSRMGDLVVSQNGIIEVISMNFPSEENGDYYYVTEQMLQTYLFMIQGEIKVLEQMYEEDESKRDESNLKIGYAFQNTMGEIILQYPRLINDVRDTDYSPNYTYVPDENSLTIEDIMNDKEFLEYLETSPEETD